MASFRVVRKTTAADAAKLAHPPAGNPDPLSSDGGRNEPDELCSRTAVTQLKLFDAASAALASSGKAHLALGFCLDEAGSATFEAPPTHAFVSLFASDFRSVRAGLRNFPRAKRAYDRHDKRTDCIIKSSPVLQSMVLTRFFPFTTLVVCREYEASEWDSLTPLQSACVWNLSDNPLQLISSRGAEAEAANVSVPPGFLCLHNPTWLRMDASSRGVFVFAFVLYSPTLQPLLPGVLSDAEALRC